MKDELNYSLEKLQTAFSRLQESIQKASDELDRDGVIKRFEFTFELFWKTIKVLLEHEGFGCAGPRSCIKEGARRGFTADSDALLDMLEDRNKLSHIYDEAVAQAIFERIKGTYVALMERNIKLFEDYIRNA
jgi:nucleotidyltransferase substrate binding protein (TIGR01987 family)